jgi:hypothetical protein
MRRERDDHRSAVRGRVPSPEAKEMAFVHESGAARSPGDINLNLDQELHTALSFTR